MFIVEHRQRRGSPFASEQGDRCCAVGGGRDRVERGASRWNFASAASEEAPHARPRRNAGQRRPGDARCSRSSRTVVLGQGIEVDQGEFGIGLADVDDGDVAHGITACERRLSEARRQPVRCQASRIHDVGHMGPPSLHDVGWAGRVAMVWSSARQRTPNRGQFVSSSRWIE